MSFLPSCKTLLLSGLTALLASCASTPEFANPTARPYTPRVSVPDPGRLTENERRYLPEVEHALEDAGYRTTQGDAEYRLDIHMEDGPINADTRLAMFRGSAEIARANARSGGGTMILRRKFFVNDSFQKCLNDFVNQIPHVGSGRGYKSDDRYPQPYPNDNRGYQDQGYRNPQPQPDWQRGY